MIKIISPWFIRVFRPRGVVATTFVPFVVIFKDEITANDPITVNHEAIHGWQMVECLLVGMWPIIIWYKFTGNRNPFEKEAYANQMNQNYLKTRKLYAWRKYL